MTAPDLAYAYAVFAGVLDVGANIASTKSDGFSKRGWGILSILLVVAAFSFLAKATQGIDLPVAYAILGATGIFGTALVGRLFLGNRLKPIAWLGFCLVLAAMIVLQPVGS